MHNQPAEEEDALICLIHACSPSAPSAYDLAMLMSCRSSELLRYLFTHRRGRHCPTLSLLVSLWGQPENRLSPAMAAVLPPPRCVNSSASLYLPVPSLSQTGQ